MVARCSPLLLHPLSLLHIHRDVVRDVEHAVLHHDVGGSFRVGTHGGFNRETLQHEPTERPRLPILELDLFRKIGGGLYRTI